MKNNFKIGLLIFCLIVCSSFALHKFYVSVTQIDYVPNKKRIEITSRIFIDDLEKALTKKHQKKPNITSTNELPEAEEWTKEVEGDVLIIYTKIAISKKINTFEFYNSLLTETFQDQQNIVHTNINSNKKSFLLTNTVFQEKIDY
jgi:hypothetical protein